MAILGLALLAMTTITMFQDPAPSGSGSAGGGAVVAKVGKWAIGENELMRAVENTVRSERESNPDVNNSSFAAAGGTSLVLQQLITGRSLVEYAGSNKMAVSRRMVDGGIASIPAFQVNGAFDEGSFRRLLQAQQITEEQIRQDIGDNLLRRQILDPVSTGVFVPKSMAEPYARLLLEVHRGGILAIPSASMKDPGKPSDEDLQGFYEEQKQAFTIPERRAFRYVLVDNEALAKKAAPSDEEARKYYQDNLENYVGVEQRVVNQVVLPGKQDADEFLAKVKAGESFAKVAAGLGYSADDIALGARSQDNLASATVPAVAKAAFGLAADSVSDPIQSPLGYHVLQVTKIVPPAARPYEAVQAEIKKDLADERLADLRADTVATAEDNLAEGQSFTDVAKALGTEIVTSEPLTADGRHFDADYKATDKDGPLLKQLLDRAFAAELSEGPHAVDLGGDQYALLEVMEVVSPSAIPLDKVRAEAEAAWQLKRRSDVAKALAEQIAADTEAGEGKAKTLAQASAGHKLDPVQQISVRRLDLTQMIQQGQQVPPPVLMVLNLPAGKAHVMPAPGGQGWFVVRADEIEAGDTESAAQLTDAVRSGLSREAGDELADSFMRAIGREIGVVSYPSNVQALNRKLTGEDVD